MILFIITYVLQILIERLPNEEKLGEILVKLCVSILEKAVASTQTDMDDELLEKVKTALRAS